MVQCATFSNSLAIYWIHSSLRNSEKKKKALLSAPRLFGAAASKDLLQKEIANNWKEGNPLKQSIMDWGYTGRTLEEETKTDKKPRERNSPAGQEGAGPIPVNTWNLRSDLLSVSQEEVCVSRGWLQGSCSTEPPLQRYKHSQACPGTQPFPPSQQLGCSMHFINTASISECLTVSPWIKLQSVRSQDNIFYQDTRICIFP